MGKAVLHVIVDELAVIGVGKLIASLGKLAPSIAKAVAQYGTLGAAGKASGELIDRAMKQVVERLDEITKKAPVAGGALTTAMTSATAAVWNLNAALAVTIAELQDIIAYAYAAGDAIANMNQYVPQFGSGVNLFQTPGTFPNPADGTIPGYNPWDPYGGFRPGSIVHSAPSAPAQSSTALKVTQITIPDQAVTAKFHTMWKEVGATVPDLVTRPRRSSRSSPGSLPHGVARGGFDRPDLGGPGSTAAAGRAPGAIPHGVA